MNKTELIAKAKLRCRKMSADILDEDIGQLVNVVLADLKRIGVHSSYLDPENITDPLIIEAVLVYTDANFGHTESRSVITGLNGYSVYNKKHYQLTHLLEKGHQLRKGGRKVGNVKAFEHIAPVNETLGDLAVSKIRQKVRG